MTTIVDSEEMYDVLNSGLSCWVNYAISMQGTPTTIKLLVAYITETIQNIKTESPELRQALVDASIDVLREMNKQYSSNSDEIDPRLKKDRKNTDKLN